MPHCGNTIVVEATRTGGARITAQYAIDYGRDVYALPGSRRNPASIGCNELLHDGAKPLLDPSDVLFAIGRGGTLDGGWKPAPKPPASRDERAVIRALAGDGASIDQIEQRVRPPVETVVHLAPKPAKFTLVIPPGLHHTTNNGHPILPRRIAFFLRVIRWPFHASPSTERLNRLRR